MVRQFHESSPHAVEHARAKFAQWQQGALQSENPALQAYTRIAGHFVTHFDTYVIARKCGIIAINKPAGLLSHSGSPLTPYGVAEGVQLSTGNPGSGIVHRLDRDTSGMILAAEDKATQRSLQRQFEAREVRKTYVAIVEGEFNDQVTGIIAPLRPSNNRRRPMEVSLEEGAKKAATSFRPILRLVDSQTGKQYTVVEVGLHKSGRTHQIRAHMKEVGHPIVGDPQYNDYPEGAGRQLLHAFEISVRQPRTQPEEGKRLTFRAPLPPDFIEFIQRMKIVESTEAFEEIVAHQ